MLDSFCFSQCNAIIFHQWGATFKNACKNFYPYNCRIALPEYISPHNLKFAGLEQSFSFFSFDFFLFLFLPFLKILYEPVDYVICEYFDILGSFDVRQYFNIKSKHNAQKRVFFIIDFSVRDVFLCDVSYAGLLDNFHLFRKAAAQWHTRYNLIKIRRRNLDSSGSHNFIDHLEFGFLVAHLSQWHRLKHYLDLGCYGLAQGSYYNNVILFQFAVIKYNV